MEALAQADVIVFVASGVDLERDREARDLLGENLRALGTQALPRVYQWTKRDREDAASPGELRDALGLKEGVQALQAVPIEGRGVRETFDAALRLVEECFRADPLAFLMARQERRARELSGFRPRSRSREAVAKGAIDLPRLVEECFDADLVEPGGPERDSPSESPGPESPPGFFRRLFGRY